SSLRPRIGTRRCSLWHGGCQNRRARAAGRVPLDSDVTRTVASDSIASGRSTRSGREPTTAPDELLNTIMAYHELEHGVSSATADKWMVCWRREVVGDNPGQRYYHQHHGGHCQVPHSSLPRDVRIYAINHYGSKALKKKLYRLSIILRTPAV